jgi:hypothetical protein
MVISWVHAGVTIVYDTGKWLFIIRRHIGSTAVSNQCIEDNVLFGESISCKTCKLTEFAVLIRRILALILEYLLDNL